MPISELRLIRRCDEFKNREDASAIARNTRGMYALLKYRPVLKKNIVQQEGKTTVSEVREKAAQIGWELSEAQITNVCDFLVALNMIEKK